MTRNEFDSWLTANHEDALDRAKQSGTSVDGWIDRLASELKSMARKTVKSKSKRDEDLFDSPDDGEDDEIGDDSEEDGDE